MRRSVRLPVEGNLVDYRDLKAGDLRLAVFLPKPDIIRSSLLEMGKDKYKDCHEQPVKKYLGSLASHCKGAAILTEGDMGDSIWILL